MKMTPNTTHVASADEVRNSMLRWFAETFGSEYTVEEWRSFKAMLYPDPLEPMPVPTGPDYEAMYESKMEDTMPRNWGA